VPLTAGFIGKFVVFSAAVEGGAWPLVVVAVLASAAAAFFYVRVIVVMFFTPPKESADGGAATVVRTEGLTTVAVAVCVLGTILLGVLPGPLLDLAADATKFLL